VDEWQERYLEHQKRKKRSLEDKNYGVKKFEYTLENVISLKEIMLNRRSQRVFNDIKITKEQFGWLLKAIAIAPSSCNRQAIYVKEADKDFLESILVGGKNWLNKANKILLIFGSKEAYKSPNEKDFMPYLDAGFVGQNIYLMAEVLGLGCCFVNPNIREENKSIFIKKYGDDYFCGAIALGNYEKKAKKPLKRKAIEVLK